MTSPSHRRVPALAGLASLASLAGLASLAVLAALAALATTACRPVQSGAAAIVGGDSIAVGIVQRQVTQVIAKADTQTASDLTKNEADLQRQVLTRLIDGLILETAARTQGVTVTEGDIDAEQATLLQQAGGADQLQVQAIRSGIAPQNLRSVVRQLAINSKLANAVVADVTVTDAQLRAEYAKNLGQFDKVHAAHILVQTQAKAEQILAQVKADAGTFAKLAAANSIDTNSKDTGGDLGSNGQASFDPTFGRAVFAATPGSFFVVHTQFGWHVVHVITHDITTLAQATPQLRTSILKAEADKRLTALLDGVMKRLHIAVNPRYGYWDAANRAVAPPRGTDQLSRPMPTPTPSATGQLAPGQSPPNG